MKSLIEFDTLLYSRNIVLTDLHPRNIITFDGRAVFIDFANAYIGKGALYMQSLFKSFEFRFDNYVSPLLRWNEYHNQVSLTTGVLIGTGNLGCKQSLQTQHIQSH